MSIASAIARLGTNPTFIAFNAHWGFAYFLMTVWPHWGWVLVAAALKEFWFDATYEVPKQGLEDNVTDWMGYAFGVVVWAIVR